jgi:hypothetical protein
MNRIIQFISVYNSFFSFSTHVRQEMKPVFSVLGFQYGNCYEEFWFKRDTVYIQYLTNIYA